MTVKLSPLFNDAQLDSSGNPYSGALLFTYGAGGSTKQTTYQDQAGLTPHTNPIVLNARGEPPAPIWLTEGLEYKFVLTIPTDTDPPVAAIRTVDDVSGVNDGTGLLDEWVASGFTPTFVSSTSFTVAGDRTTILHVGRRIKSTNTGGTIYSTITSSSHAAGTTTIGVASDAGTSLDSGLSAVSYSTSSANNPSIDADMVNRKGTAVASAATTNVWGIAGDYVHVTGTTGITSFGTAPYAGAQRTVIFDGVLQITHNATTLQCPEGQSITTAAGDRAIVRADTTANMIIVSYTRATVANPPKSLAPNPFFQVNQRQGSSLADDTYGPDRWYALTQTAAITYAGQTLQENGQATNVRLTQANAAAQRFGLATIIEAADSQPLRGKTITFRPRVRISNSQALRMAVLEWTGTADSVTSDVVNDWTSAAYTAGNFFLGANLTVAGVGAKTPSAATWTDMDALTVTISSSCNNLILLVWVEGTAAQNVTLDLGKMRLVLGADASEIYVPTFEETLAHCQRYYEKSYAQGTAPATATAVGLVYVGIAANSAATTIGLGANFRVDKRSAPTMSYWDGAGNATRMSERAGGAWTDNRTITALSSSETGFVLDSGSANQSSGFVHYAAVAEL